MSETKKEPASTQKNYIIHPSDLPLSCPTDQMELWNAHPKVYLPIEKTGTEVCPYCNARYILKDD
jgi:uncharacterized Zn-finger protein